MIEINRPLPRVSLRPRLFRQLDLMRTAPAVWVSANAGAGKTSLVSSYVENRGIPCLWYQFDRADTDVGSFFYLLGQAAAKTYAEMQAGPPLFMPEYSQGLPAFAHRYFETLYHCFSAPFLLVFDDYQEVPPDSPLHEIICIALTCLPEGMNVVIISRNDPPAQFIRLQANRTLGVLRWNDIRFNEQETLDMFGDKGEALFTPEMIMCLHRLTDGWAAGLVLMSQAVQRESIAMGALTACPQEGIFTYFAQEVFESLERKTREFLVKVALLPRMTPRMAAVLTGLPTAGELLQMLVHNNFFIVRNDDAVYAFHPLYRDFLLMNASKILGPELFPAVQRQAADLLVQAGQIEAALHLLRELGDWQGLSKIIMDHAADMLKQGRHHSLQEWFGLLPDDAVKADPWLLYWKGMASLAQTPPESRVCFEEAFACFRAEGRTTEELLAASGAASAIVAGQEDFTPLAHWFTVLNDLVKSVKTFPNDEAEAWVTASMITALGVLEIPHPDAEIWIERARNLQEIPETVTPKMHALFQLFWYQGVNRGMNGLFPLYQEMQRLARSPFATPYAQLMAKVVQTQYFEAAGMPAECMQAVEEALVFSDKHGIPLYGTTLNFMAIACCLDQMDIKSAHERLEKMLPHLADAKPWAGASMHHQFARAALIRKAYEEAFYHAELAFRMASRIGSPFIAGCSHWMMAQILYCLNRRGEARCHLDQCFAIVKQHGTRWVAVMAYLYDAQFAFDCGDERRGLQSLRVSLETARDGGYLMTCFDDPTVTVRMCVKALEAGIEIEHVQKIIRTRRLVPDDLPVHVEQWPWPIRIYTLGRFGIVRDGKAIACGRKPQQMPLRLLKCLISLGGRGVAEERLADILWPDAEGDMAHHAFKTTLHRLRKLLDDQDAIRLSGGRVTIDRQRCWIDAWTLEILLGRADTCRRQGDPENAKRLTQKAGALYRGEFLSGENDVSCYQTFAQKLHSAFQARS